MVNEEHRWEAPGPLELVRVFLNTGLPPPDGSDQDRLLELRADPARWAAAFPDVPRPAPGRLAELLELRGGLVRLLTAAPAAVDAAWLSGWCERTGLGVRVAVEGGALAIRFASPARSGLAGSVVEAVATALAAGSWSRLRRCPDCRLGPHPQREQDLVWDVRRHRRPGLRQHRQGPALPSSPGSRRPGSGPGRRRPAPHRPRLGVC